MLTTNTTVVWFKRDLRIADHAPLAAAASASVANANCAVLPLYVIEPSIFNAPDFAAQHWGFIRESLVALNAALLPLGAPLVIRVGEMCDVLAELRATLALGSITLLSHQETGNALTYRRDIAVGKWCRANGVAWQEYRQHGVKRGLVKRDGWASQWDRFMSSPVLDAPTRLRAVSPAIASTLDLAAMANDHTDLSQFGITFHAPDKIMRIKAGRANGLELLHSFLETRGQHYRSSMSSPISAAAECSRLSPHIAFGTLSIREIAQALYARRSALQSLTEDARPPGMLASLKSFESRLHWHCHFIQKLESEPAIEFRNVHRGFDNVRDEGQLDEEAQQKLQAWATGMTGYPMIDACMRMLGTVGWINFRMRAMLMSFASYQLWLHWREPALHLAREFLDYEPGIHYPQAQMQSGVTGINTIRIYNPIKQARDQDPDGIFVKQWLPELARVPVEYIFEPWTMPETLQAHLGITIGLDYPKPIVDNVVASRFAREAIYAVKQQAQAKIIAKQVYEKHGSRHPLRDARPSAGASASSKRKSTKTVDKVATANKSKKEATPQLAFSWD
jgi:deoxyribodipyrimidine photo-lyase